MQHVMVFFCVLLFEVRDIVVCFVDIGRIINHHCLNFLFISTEIKFSSSLFNLLLHRGRDRMLAGFTTSTTYVISAYHH